MLALAHAGRLVLSLASVVLIGRNLAPGDFGFVALVSSVYIVAVELIDMGTTAIATRDVAARPGAERETLAALLALRRILSIVAVAVVAGVACSDYVIERDQRAVLAVAALGLFALHFHAYQLVFQVRQAYGRLVLLALGVQLGFLLACAAALSAHAGGAVIGLLVVARELALVLGSRLLAMRMLGSRVRAPWRHPGMRRLIGDAWMIGVGGLSYKLATYAGAFMLWEISSPESLATFSAAQRFVLPLGELAWLVATPLIAAMSAAVTHDKAAFRVQLEGYAKFLASLSALAGIAGYFVAPFLLRLLYGEQYASGPLSAVEVFRWLALGYVFAMVSPVLIVGEMVQGNTRALMRIAFACLALSLAGNAWAIPRYGAAGVAMVMFACEALVFAVLLARATARGDLRLDAGFAAHLAPAALLAGALWLLADAPGWQFALACAWAPLALLAVMQLPAQKACRASLAKNGRAIQWDEVTTTR